MISFVKSYLKNFIHAVSRPLPSSNTLDLAQSTDHKTIKLNYLDHALKEATVAYITLDPLQYRIKNFNTLAGYWFNLHEKDNNQPITYFIRSPVLTQFLASEQFECALFHHQHYFCIRRIPLSEHFFLLQIEKQSDQLKRLKAEQDFLASVSHEINTPITVISGYMDLLESQLDDSQHTSPLIKTMRQQTQRLSHLAQQLLSLLRAENNLPKFQWIDSTTFFDRLKAETVALNKKNKDIHWNIDNSLDIYGDETLLYSAFRNLINNALHYTPKEISIIHIRWYETPHYSYFEVEDNGIGIAQEYIHRLGERFFRIDNQNPQQGSGLGLSLVKHSIQQHNAALAIRSKLGEGSLFRVTFNASSTKKHTHESIENK